MTPSGASAVTNLKDAQLILSHPEAIPIGSWSRAVAVLGRQSIERGVTDLFNTVEPSLATLRNHRAKFLCLRQYIDPDLAGRTYFTWIALSHACHHHAFELAPTELELQSWLETTAEFLQTVGQALSRAGS